MSRGPKPKYSQQPPGVVPNWSAPQCSKKHTEQCGYDHAPVTRGRMRAQFPLPHAPPPLETGTVGGWWVRADPDVQMAKAKAQSAATWSGTELVCAAVQRGKTLNYVVMTMRL